MVKESYISIFVKHMRPQVRIGFLDHEQVAPQALNVSIELFVAPDYLKAASKDQLLDYGYIYRAVMAWEGRDQVDLIESYMQEALDIAFAKDLVQAVKIEITKPDIFEHAQCAGLKMEIERAGYEALYT